MKNTTELREELGKMFKELREGTLDLKEAKAAVAMCNTMVKSAIGQFDYTKFTGDKASIPFLKTPRDERKI